MGRNNDGTVTLNRDFIIDDANNDTLTGSKLQENFTDLANVATNSLDLQGRTVMQSDIDAGNFNLINLADPKSTTDGVNFKTLLAYENGIQAIDNGSDAGNGIIKLSLSLSGLTELNRGFKIKFTAPFTMTPEAMKNAKRYELIELTVANGTLEYPVLRGAYTEVDPDLYEDDIKDNRPTFLEGEEYSLMFNGSAWVSDDKVLSGTITPFGINSYTPAGYKDLSYNYDELDYQKYPFLRAYSPRKDIAAGEDPETGYTNNFKFGAENLAMLPEHGHNYLSSNNYKNVGGNGTTVADDSYSSKNTEGTIVENIQVGDDLYPSNISIRLLQKI